MADGSAPEFWTIVGGRPANGRLASLDRRCSKPEREPRISGRPRSPAARAMRARTRLSACRLQCVEHRGERIYRFLDRTVQNCLISMQREFSAAGRHLGCRADCDPAVDELLG
jgi:hypothetical protein